MKRFILLILIILTALGYRLYTRFFPLQDSGTVSRPIPVTSNTADDSSSSIESMKLVEVARELRVPWSISFMNDTDFLFTERPGTVRAFIGGKISVEPVLELSVSSVAEEGLMGLVVDPDYVNNKYVYVSYAYPQDARIVVRVSRFTHDMDVGALVSERVLVDNIPAARFHAGGRLAFGPDGKLYITTGDAQDPDSAQDMESLAGKILRINSDGTIPDDNPNGYMWYSYGHRNSQGIAWSLDGTVLYSTEHGPSGGDGPGGGDEVNVIEAGANYGWPLVSHRNTRTGTVPPVMVYTPAVAPASALIYSGKIFSDLQGNLLFGGLRGEGIYRVEFSPTDPTEVISTGKLPIGDLGRIREVVESPNGEIYFTTSNTDGRGNPLPGDDKIYKIISAED